MLPYSTPLPYTTLFRSGRKTGGKPSPSRLVCFAVDVVEQAGHQPGDVADGAHRAAVAHPRRTKQAQRAVRSEDTRLNSSHVKTSYAVFCLKKKKENYGD